MKQKTIGKKIELVGKGLHKGVSVRLVLEPLSANSGIVFVRSDLGIEIPLHFSNVVDTQLATTLGKGEARISTIEHLLSAIHAYGIDNLKISVDSEEIPVMDGSAIGYCMLLEEAGIVEQDAIKCAMILKKPLKVEENNKFVSVMPNDKMIFDFSIDFNHPVIKKQSYKFEFSTLSYKEQIARARTFGFLEEVNYLRSIGLAKGGDLSNCIVLDESGILNKDGLRYKEEFVRHKILDAIGDMSILGMPLVGSYISFAGSHKLNHLLTEKILNDASAYEVVPLGELATATEEILAPAFAR